LPVAAETASGAEGHVSHTLGGASDLPLPEVASDEPTTIAVDLSLKAAWPYDTPPLGRVGAKSAASDAPDGTLAGMDVCSEAEAPERECFPPPSRPRGGSLWLARLQADRRELSRFWPVLENMVVSELRVRYQRSILGFFWTLLNPLLMMVTLTLVFSSLNPRVSNYPLFLFAGMLPWSFLSTSVSESSFCIISNEGLIKKIYLPKLIFPLARVLISLITFLLSLGAMFLLLWPLGARLAPAVLFLPVAIGLLATFVLGLSLIVATANTFYRDCGHLVSVFLHAWYFLTPILFPIEQFPANIQWRFRLNPAFYFVELFHDMFVTGCWPRAGLVAAALLISSASLGIGYVVFKSYENKMVFRL
jgi:ABC-2 type transport system permease protein/lipopolysaccharide transport system permease protein